MDVVDANREDWEYDPFTLRGKEMAILLDAARRTTNIGVEPMSRRHSCASRKRALFRTATWSSRHLPVMRKRDEHTRKCSRNDRPDLAEAEFALNSLTLRAALTEDGKGLPYFMQSAEKTYATFQITARNPGGHSSRPRHDNAIYDLAHALLKHPGLSVSG